MNTHQIPPPPPLNDFFLVPCHLQEYQFAWEREGLLGRISYPQLTHFLGSTLPPPLGMGGLAPNYLVLSRFIKKILLNMPCDAKRCDDTPPINKVCHTLLYTLQHLLTFLINKSFTFPF